jgi:hypothetical protein
MLSAPEVGDGHRCGPADHPGPGPLPGNGIPLSKSPARTVPPAASRARYPHRAAPRLPAQIPPPPRPRPPLPHGTHAPPSAESRPAAAWPARRPDPFYNRAPRPAPWPLHPALAAPAASCAAGRGHAAGGRGRNRGADRARVQRRRAPRRAPVVVQAWHGGAPAAWAGISCRTLPIDWTFWGASACMSCLLYFGEGGAWFAPVPMTTHTPCAATEGAEQAWEGGRLY